VRDRLRLAVRFDPEALGHDLSMLEATEWVDHFVTQNYEGTWSVLPLRAPADAVHPIKMIYSDPACDTFVDTPLLERCRYFQQVLATFQCPLHAVRLMKLTPGSTIKPHSDHDLAPEYGTVRLHVPVTTNPEVDFRLNGTAVPMREGECWYLRLSDTHAVANRGRVDRVHLVLDALMNPWLLEQLTDAERAADEPSPESDLERFRRAVVHDMTLQRRLSTVEDRNAFIALAIQLASEHGYKTTAGEIDGAMQDAQRRWREPM
jgi:hypothetical protein